MERKRSIWAGASVATLVVMWSSAADASCIQRGRFRFSAEGPWPMALQVNSGGSCEHTFRSFGRVMFKRLYVVSPPSHGSIALREGGHYRYTNKAGYRGADAFTLRVCGQPSGEGSRVRCANLAYQVHVQ